ncbi:MAG: ferritin-like domain-containing protein, partial [Myxococcales bacterium]|nr:ferritin-like domain-containing protein [Myxococcales bacterium]
MMGQLSLHPGQGPMRSEYDRVLRFLRKKGGGSREEAPRAIDFDAFDARTLAAGRRVWKRRMITEHHSSTVFAGLLPQLIEAGATVDMKTLVMRMAMDELRHGTLCATMVEALGADSTVDVPLETPPLPTHPGCAPLETVLRNVLFVSCLAETVAVAFTSHEREETTEPLALQTITEISSDEVLHARFGWAFAKEAVPNLTETERKRMEAYLRTAFRYLEREEMLEVPNVRPPSEQLVEEGQAIGVCDNVATRELFYATVHQSIIPGL